ncbi:hypothetical protein ESOMN_v1c06040 [Williamsoniiplasma somnilux]|uniref:Uncharacterized protein n=1 Tax=Williamsoniiplasma somnilux TaxID=215578 RepID=A0A2K8NZL3_9MOLU|nr:ABC transporter permease subunit [Williamsoniiplasma somnilux]ATZ18986.1 hypothetical protein ESOMN_v1c06040 [Williamsoniiplasma somnilux]
MKKFQHFNSKKHKTVFLVWETIKINKKIIIFFSIIFIIMTLFSNVAATMNGTQTKTTIATTTWENPKDLYSRNMLSIATIYNWVIFGKANIILMTLFTLTYTSRIFAKEIDNGSIQFWLTKPISKETIFKTKTISSFLLIIFYWFICCLISFFFLFSVYDIKNVGYVILKMLNFLILMALISSLIIGSIFLLKDKQEMHFLIWAIFIIYLLLIMGLNFMMGDKFTRYIDIENFFPHVLQFDKTKVDYQISINNYGDYQYIYQHESFSYIHLIASWLLMPFITVITVWSTKQYIWDKLEFTI